MPLIRNLTLTKKRLVRGDEVNPNIALGDTLLTNDSKTRAYWDFTNIDRDDWDVLTSHPDSSVNGTYNLINNSGAFLPSLGFFNIGSSVVSTLRARTTSGIKNGFITSQNATNLGNGEREYHFLFTLQDGVIGNSNKLSGVHAVGGGIRIGIDDTGKIYFTFTLPPGSVYCNYLSNSAVIANGVTDIHVLRVRMTTTSVTFMLDGVNVPCSLSAGVDISTITISSYSTAMEYGVGGVSFQNGGTKEFITDSNLTYKYILKHAITDLLTDTEYLQIVASFLNLNMVSHL